MKKVHITVMTLALALACAKGEQSKAAATDSTARNLTLAPSETSAARHDVPVREPTPAARPPVARPKPVTPPAPTMYTAPAGTHLDMAVSDTITSRTNHAGDAFTAKVVDDVKDARGHVVIPAGAVVAGTVTAGKPGPKSQQPGAPTLAGSGGYVPGPEAPLPA